MVRAGQVRVATTATQLVVAGNGGWLTVSNRGGGGGTNPDVYLGPDGLAATEGYALAHGETIAFPVVEGIDLHAVWFSATPTTDTVWVHWLLTT